MVTQLTIKSLLSALLITAVLSSSAFASGSYGGTSGSFNQSRTQKQIDPSYEEGKAIFSGRSSASPKLAYCVDVDGERLKVKRSSLKSFKRDTVQSFAEKLYSCDNPEQRISEQLSQDELLYVLYYLNKRFKLYLG